MTGLLRRKIRTTFIGPKSEQNEKDKKKNNNNTK